MNVLTELSLSVSIFIAFLFSSLFNNEGEGLQASKLEPPYAEQSFHCCALSNWVLISSNFVSTLPWDICSCVLCY